MLYDPELIVEAGQLLTQFGRWHQRTFPPFTTEGAQCGEDSIIAGLLAGRSGTYVDVGASDPIECSNTWRLYQNGWPGLLIEPLPSCWYQLRRQRPQDQLSMLGASNRRGWGVLRLCRSVSSLRSDWNITEDNRIFIEVAPLREILADYPDIRDRCQFLSMDVEGHEREALEGVDWTSFHPYLLCIEHVRYAPLPGQSGTLESEWLPDLESKGYAVHTKTAYNTLLLRRENP